MHERCIYASAAQHWHNLTSMGAADSSKLSQVTIAEHSKLLLTAALVVTH